MDNGAYPWFALPCLKAFAPLVSEFGFESPTVEQIAYECYVRFKRGEEVVSISYEPGFLPLVEISLTPSLKDKRIPHSRVPSIAALIVFHKKYTKLCRAQKYTEADAMMKDADTLEPHMLKYMTDQFDLLKKTESVFLGHG